MPTFEDLSRICRSVMVSSPRSWASETSYSSAWMALGQNSASSGVMTLFSSTAMVDTVLKTEPGSNA